MADELQVAADVAGHAPRPDTLQVLWVAVAGVLALGVLAHAFFPRYEWRPVGDNGSAIVVYDRWSGRFQRAVYDENGTLRVMDVFTPF
jgi:hypothetical protein